MQRVVKSPFSDLLMDSEEKEFWEWKLEPGYLPTGLTVEETWQAIDKFRKFFPYEWIQKNKTKDCPAKFLLGRGHRVIEWVYEMGNNLEALKNVEGFGKLLKKLKDPNPKGFRDIIPELKTAAFLKSKVGGIEIYPKGYRCECDIKALFNGQSVFIEVKNIGMLWEEEKFNQIISQKAMEQGANFPKYIESGKLKSDFDKLFKKGEVQYFPSGFPDSLKPIRTLEDFFDGKIKQHLEKAQGQLPKDKMGFCALFASSEIHRFMMGDGIRDMVVEWLQNKSLCGVILLFYDYQGSLPCGIFVNTNCDLYKARKNEIDSFLDIFKNYFHIKN